MGHRYSIITIAWSMKREIWPQMDLQIQWTSCLRATASTRAVLAWKASLNIMSIIRVIKSFLLQLNTELTIIVIAMQGVSLITMTRSTSSRVPSTKRTMQDSSRNWKVWSIIRRKTLEEHRDLMVATLSRVEYLFKLSLYKIRNTRYQSQTGTVNLSFHLVW